MRESSMSQQPINPQETMENGRLDRWEFDSKDGEQQINDEILPFMKDHSEDGIYTAVFIAQFLSMSDEHIIDTLIEQDIEAGIFIDQYYKPIKKSLDEGMILKNAPWFKTLENKIMALELYIAGLVDEEIVEANRNAFIDEVKKKFSKGV